MKNHLVIDGQIFQTDAWYRGMGKYTLQVLRELSQSFGSRVDVVVLFNASLDCDKERFSTLDYLCPNVRQVIVKLPLPSDRHQGPEEYRKSLQKCIDNEALGGETSYLITSIFSFDFFAEFPPRCRKFLLFYDLTPLLFWRYLGGYFPPELYMQRFTTLLEAEHIFSISETTKQDLTRTFGFPPEMITNINGGYTKIAEMTRRPSINAPEEYILFPTGNLPHKNNEVAIRGYAQYRRQTKRALPLLVTSHFSTESRQRLESLCPDIIFTGNVSDEELEWLYEHAGAILFASLYEGLGMPILDAVANKKPIITSRIPVFEEMSRQAFYYFDPNSPDDLCRVLEKALSGKELSARLREYPGIMQKYTWANTASMIEKQVSAPPEDQAGSKQVVKVSNKRLAVVCVHPGIEGQIGRLAEPLYYHLRGEFMVDYYLDPNGFHYKDMGRPTFLNFMECRVFDISKFTLRVYGRYDRVLYLIDDWAFPSRLAQKAAVLPGVALTNFAKEIPDVQNGIFRDTVLDNLFKTTSAPTSPKGYATIASWVKAAPANSDHDRSLRAAVSLLKKGRLSKGIIKKLTRLTVDEKE